jgi:uncharacterized protein (UPF0332 family)
MGESGNNKDVANYKLERAKDDFESAELLLKSGKLKVSNNRAYYACFHAVDAVLALEPIAFKKHKDTLSYFNKNYIHTEKFPKDIGRQISRLEVIRHKSDYDDFYIASKSETEEQVMIAGNVIKLVEDYLNSNNKVSE